MGLALQVVLTLPYYVITLVGFHQVTKKVPYKLGFLAHIPACGEMGMCWEWHLQLLFARCGAVMRLDTCLTFREGPWRLCCLEAPEVLNCFGFSACTKGSQPQQIK